MNTASEFLNVAKGSKLGHQKYTGLSFTMVALVLMMWYWIKVSGTFCKQKNG